MVQGHTESHIVGTAGHEAKCSKVSGLFFCFCFLFLFIETVLWYRSHLRTTFFLPGNVNTEQYYLC